MKKQIAFPVAGLLFTCCLIVSFVLRLNITQSVPSDFHWFDIYNSINRLLIIGIYLIFRYIIVNQAKLARFGIIIDMVILLKILEFVFLWIFNFRLLDSKFSGSPITILWASSILIFLWLLVALIRINKKMLTGLIYLQIYVGIVLFINISSFAVPFLFRENPTGTFHSLQAFYGIQYLPLLIFFIQHIMAASKNSTDYLTSKRIV